MNFGILMKRDKLIYFIGFIILVYITSLISQSVFSWSRSTIALKVQAVLSNDKGFYEVGDIVDFNITFELDRNHINYKENYQVDIINYYFTDVETENFLITFSSFDSLIVINDSIDVVNGNITIEMKKLVNHSMVSFMAYVVGDNNSSIQYRVDKGEIPEDYPNLDWYRNHTYEVKISFSNNAKVLD